MCYYGVPRPCALQPRNTMLLIVLMWLSCVVLSEQNFASLLFTRHFVFISQKRTHRKGVFFFGVPRPCALQPRNTMLLIVLMWLSCVVLSEQNFASLLFTRHFVFISQKRTHRKGVFFFGVPEGIRTPGLSLRRRTLYPTELLRHRLLIIYIIAPFVKCINLLLLYKIVLSILKVVIV